MGFTVYCGHYIDAINSTILIDHFNVSCTSFTLFKKALFKVVYQFSDHYKDIITTDDYLDNLIKLPVDNRPFTPLLLASDINGSFNHSNESLELSYHFKDYADLAGQTFDSYCMKQYVEWWKIFSFSAHNKLNITYE